MTVGQVRYRASQRRHSPRRSLLLPQAGAAQGADQFFKGKTINLYIGFGAGGTYDYYGRLVARFIGRHIPGEPTVIAQSMPGSGSLRAANFLFSAAPKDGTALGVDHPDGGDRGRAALAGRAVQGRGVQLDRPHDGDPGGAFHLEDLEGQDHRGRAPARNSGRRHRRRLAVGRLSKAAQRVCRHEIQDHLRLSELDRRACWRWSAARSTAG